MTRLYLIILLLSGINLYSQFDFNRLSIEGAGGFNIPLSPDHKIDIGDYTVPRHFDIGARFALTRNWSVKLYYSYDRFQNKLLKGVGNTYHRLSLEGYFNIAQAFGLLETSQYNLLVHAGAGITHAYPEAIQRYLDGGRFTFGLTPNISLEYERIATLLFGVTLQRYVSKKITLTLDSTYVYTAEHQYGYNGELLFEDYTKVKGDFLNFTLGLQYAIGRKERHADWVDKR